MESKIKKIKVYFDDDFFKGKTNNPLSMERGGKGNVATDRNSYSQKEIKLFATSRQFDELAKRHTSNS